MKPAQWRFSVLAHIADALIPCQNSAVVIGYFRKRPGGHIKNRAVIGQLFLSGAGLRPNKWGKRQTHGRHHPIDLLRPAHGS